MKNYIKNMLRFKAGIYKQQFGYKSFYPRLINNATFEIESKNLNLLVEEASSLLGKLNAYSSLFPNIDFFIQMHVIKEATTSSLIEGTKTSINEVLLPNEDVNPERRDDWQEVQNYIKAIKFAISKLKELPLSIRLINDAHHLLLSVARGKYKNPGEIRKTQNWIGGNTLTNAKFIPPHSDDLPTLLTDLEKFWHNEKTNLPFLVKVALSHYQFETIHPYLDGNGRIGRLLIILQLIERGILHKPILYLSEYFEKYRIEYFDSLTRVRTNDNLEPWLVFFLNGVIETSRNGTKTLDKIKELQNNFQEKISALGRREKLGNKLLEILFKSPLVNVNKIVKELGVTFPTANAIIYDFEKLGIFKEVTGYARNRLFSFINYINLFKNT